MYTKGAERSGVKTEKQLLFADAELYTIPANEGWNEGYSHTNKFLYFKDIVSTTATKDKTNWVATLK